jgi:hypothetical protein
LSGIATLGPLGRPQFRLLFLGRTVSFFGNAMATVALAFAVLEVTGSKSDLGFVIAAPRCRRSSSSCSAASGPIAFRATS